MKFKWANLLLFFLVFFQIATGVFGLVAGSTPFFIDLHGIGGLAILAVLIWKGQNIFLAFYRYRKISVPRIAFLLLLILLLSTLTTGILWTTIDLPRFLGFSFITWHIILGSSLLPLLLLHFLARRRIGLPSADFSSSRRTFLKFAGISVVGLVLWRGSDLIKGPLGLAGAQRRFTGSYEKNSFSGNDFPITSWLFDNPKPVDEKSWRLVIDGAVKRALELSYDELLQLNDTSTATLDCTGGWYSTQEWKGIKVSRILERAGLEDKAKSVTFESVTGYYRRYSLAEAERSLLATHVGGEVISHAHGFPLRVVGPGKRGFDWVKWLSKIHVNETGKWLQPPLPLQ